MEEKIIEYLKASNLWGADNTYFHAYAPQAASKNQRCLYRVIKMVFLYSWKKNGNKNNKRPSSLI